MPDKVAIPCRRRTVALFAAAWGICVLSPGVHGRLPEVQDRPVRAQELPPGDGARIVGSKCLPCHGLDLIVQQRLSRAGWGREVDKMIGWGAMVEPAERETLVDYLEALFGEGTPRRTPGVSPHPGAAILEARCLTCHDARLIEEQRLTAAGWAAELDKMVRWGAMLTKSERAVLIDFLAGSTPLFQPAARR